jgi:hypothetical protein
MVRLGQGVVGGYEAEVLRRGMVVVVGGGGGL